MFQKRNTEYLTALFRIWYDGLVEESTFIPPYFRLIAQAFGRIKKSIKTAIGALRVARLLFNSIKVALRVALFWLPSLLGVLEEMSKDSGALFYLPIFPASKASSRKIEHPAP